MQLAALAEPMPPPPTQSQQQFLQLATASYDRAAGNSRMLQRQFPGMLQHTAGTALLKLLGMMWQRVSRLNSVRCVSVEPQLGIHAPMQLIIGKRRGAYQVMHNEMT